MYGCACNVSMHCVVGEWVLCVWYVLWAVCVRGVCDVCEVCMGCVCVMCGVCVYMCACVRIYMCVCIYMCVFVYICLCICCIYIYIYIRVCVCVCAYQSWLEVNGKSASKSQNLFCDQYTKILLNNISTYRVRKQNVE